MNKYKVCVYAISKNEEKHVKRWVKSMKEADAIYVLDTGSTDNTVKLLKESGVNVKSKIINPWRFDIARNESLNLIPEDYDICICTDLDEMFEEGWREKLEKVWTKDTNRLRYTYNWSLDENNKPIISFLSEKIHDRKNYIWKHPVHEIATFTGQNEIIEIDENIVINHYPDSNKSRGSYLPLLEISVKEEPEDDRNMHYLGREYMFYQKWNECIDTLIKHLNLKSATWRDERCASMRFISRSYTNLNRIDEAKMWLDKAINEAPHLRDPYIEKALLEYRLENFTEVENLCKEALKIKTHQKTYINEPFSWDNTVYDLLSISTYYNEKYEESLKWVIEALKQNPTDERLLNNEKIIKNKINELKN